MASISLISEQGRTRFVDDTCDMRTNFGSQEHKSGRRAILVILLGGSWVLLAQAVIRPELARRAEISGNDAALTGWDDFTWLILGIELFGSLLLMTTFGSRFRAFVDGISQQPGGPSRWTLGRARLVHLLIGSTLFCSLYDVVNFTEHWPFSNYSMYCVLAGPRTSRTRYVAVTASGAETELSSGAFTVSNLTLRFATKRLSHHADGERRLTSLIRELIVRHNDRVDNQQSEEDTIAGIRLYEEVWALALPESRLVRRTRLHDVMLPRTENEP